MLKESGRSLLEFGKLSEWDVEQHARSHLEEAAASDGCLHIATESLKMTTHTSSGCQKHSPERNSWFLPNQETSVLIAKV